MIIGCTVPLLLIFLLPLFGVTGNYSLLIFIVFMFGCHLMMMGKHGHKHTSQSKNKENKDESHQH
jgi:hypothetical protein